MTIFMPYFFMPSITPARTSWLNGSFSNAMATLSSPGFLLALPAFSAARSITPARYWSEVVSMANRYL